MSDITFQTEPYQVIFTPEAMELYKQHWEEIGVFDKEKIKLAPNWGMYRTLGKNNSLIVHTVREHKRLIGYSLFILCMHPHYCNTKVAENDIIFVAPNFRKGYMGYNFVKFCIKDIKKKVDIVIMRVKAGTPLSVIMRRLKFKLMDETHILEV